MAMKDILHSGEFSLQGAEEIMGEGLKRLDRLYEFNRTRPSEMDKRQALMKEMFAQIVVDAAVADIKELMILPALVHGVEIRTGQELVMSGAGGDDGVAAVGGIDVAGIVTGRVDHQHGRISFLTTVRQGSAAIWMV